MSELNIVPELCFGGFAHLVDICRNEANVKSQSDVIARMVSVIDPNNRCISSDSIGEKEISNITGEKTVVNHLIKCTQKFKLVTNFDILLKDKALILEKFKEFVNNYLDADKIPMLIYTLIYIMANDIQMSTQNKELFKEIFGCYIEKYFPQKEISVYDFLLNLLLYTVSPRLDSLNFSASISCIDINTMRKFYNSYSSDLSYDSSSQIITLSFIDDYEFLIGMLEKHKISSFLKEIDPSFRSGFEKVWIERLSLFYDSSIEYLNNKSKSKFRNLFYDFINHVNNYCNYLCFEMVCNPNTSRLHYEKIYEAAFGVKCLTWRNECKSLFDSINDFVKSAYGIATVNPSNDE